MKNPEISPSDHCSCEAPSLSVFGRIRGKIAILCLLGVLGGGCAATESFSSNIIDNTSGIAKRGKRRQKLPKRAPKTRRKGPAISPPTIPPPGKEGDKENMMLWEMTPLQRCFEMDECYYA